MSKQTIDCKQQGELITNIVGAITRIGESNYSGTTLLAMWLYPYSRLNIHLIMIGTRFCKHSLSTTIIFKLALSKFPLFIGFCKDPKEAFDDRIGGQIRPYIEQMEKKQQDKDDAVVASACN
jgi:hypothetical protein